MIDISKAVKDKTNILLFLLNILFFGYYVMLAFYARPHYDDLHFLWALKQMSISDFVNDMFFNRSGRFAGYFINGIVFKTIIFVGEYRYFPILFWFLGIGMCWFVVKSSVQQVSSFFLINIVFLFYNIFVLSNIDFAVFNWLCAMGYYLLPPMLLVTLKLVNADKLKWGGWISLLILSIVLGGGQEAFTPIVLTALFINGLYIFKLNHFKVKLTWTDHRIRRIIYAALILMSCLLIVVIAPGNYVRLSADEFVFPSNISGYILGFVKAIGEFYYFIFFYIPYYFILAVLFISIGRKYAQSIKISVSYKQLIIKSFFVYFIYMILSVLPNVYLWSGFGIQRNYTHVVFFNLLFICFQAFIFGYFKTSLISQKSLLFIINTGVVMLSVIMIANLYIDSISATNYAKSVDERIVLLEKLNSEGVKGIVSVDPISIPYTIDTKYIFYKLAGKKNNLKPVLYYISDTDKEPNEYADHLKKVYGLNFLIKLKE